MLKGTVKFYNRQKGFGFITRDDGTDDLFVSAASLSQSGIKTLDAGQRLCFEVEKDPRGFTAANLKLDPGSQQSAAPQAPALPAAAPQPAAPARATLYYDPALESHRDVAAAVETKGDGFRLIDCAANPPARDELKRLSLLLGAAGQNLVRRTDPLFFALQLDDRFLSENEFWTAVVEHPKLIDGPILAAANRARLCKTVAQAEAFIEDKEHKPVKSATPRILAMIKGHALPPLPEKALPAKAAPAETRAPSPSAKKTAQKSPKPKPVVKAKPKPKKAAKAPQKSATKSAAKAKAKSAGRSKR